MRRTAMLAVAAVLLALTACAPTVSLEPAETASDPVCAEVSVALPTELGPTAAGAALAERQTDAQATGAWGEPTVVTLRCGVEEPGPTTDLCSSVEGVDWIEVGDDETVRTFITYGRSPAVEVVVDTGEIAPTDVLSQLANAVSATEEVGGCIATSDAPVVP